MSKWCDIYMLSVTFYSSQYSVYGEATGHVVILLHIEFRIFTSPYSNGRNIQLIRKKRQT